MKICPKCKKQYDENQKFCKICGTALVEEKKKKRIGLYILIAILAIAACAGAVVTGMVIQNKKQEAQQQAQIQQNQVRAKGPHLRHHLRKLCYRLDLIPLIFQQENQLLPHGGIVFYNRNLLHL